MKKIRKWLVASLSAFMLVALSGCSVGFDAGTYVEGVLNNTYLGNAEKYMDQVDITEEEAKKEFEESLAVEAEFFMKFMDIENCSKDVKQQIADMYKAIYAKSKFTVADAEKDGDNYKVKVTVEPIQIFKENWEAISTAWDEAYSTVTDASNREQCDTIGKAMVAIITPLIDTITYGEAQTIEVAVKKEKDNLYSFSQDSFNEIDTIMIDYDF